MQMTDRERQQMRKIISLLPVTTDLEDRQGKFPLMPLRIWPVTVMYDPEVQPGDHDPAILFFAERKKIPWRAAGKKIILYLYHAIWERAATNERRMKNFITYGNGIKASMMMCCMAMPFKRRRTG